MGSGNGFGETLPSYTPQSPGLTPQADQYQAHPAINPTPEMTASKRKKGTFTGEGCIKWFPPIRCDYCDAEFKGTYQKGNKRRHIKNIHTPDAGDGEEGKKCRACEKIYKRPDARKKHEWKKHRILDARPEKRRSEKKEKRIYMPRMPELPGEVVY